MPLPDPLRLGRAGRLLPAALWLAAVGSAVASPVPRAGRLGLLLLPAFLVLPAAVERCWSGGAAPRRRLWGTRAMAAAVGGLALGALGQAVAAGGLAARPALPLGQHNLLAGWLVLLLPLAILPAREPGGWRWLGRGAGLAALAALLASRSLLGLLALATEAVLAILWMARRLSARTVRGRGGRRRRLAIPRTAGLGLVGLVGMIGLALTVGATLQARRLGELAAGRDPSARARAVYYAAGWRGCRERPALGWGPGATPWTIARFLVPVPGVDPPGEVVPDLHSLPLELAYELGAPGLLLALALGGLFVRRRLAELPRGADPALAAAGLAGLAGGAVLALGSAAVAVTALPLAAALAAGAALAGSSAAANSADAADSAANPADPAGRPAARRERLERAAPALWAALALLLLAPLLAAERSYERAEVALDSRSARRLLARAVALDPAFPLYRSRLAGLAVGTAAATAVTPVDAAAAVAPVGAATAVTPVGAATAARQAAARAYRVAPLWLQAGIQGLAAGRPWAADALRRACVLDPLSPFAPFFLAVAAPGDPAAPALAARALAADPRLAAATFWSGREDLLRRAAALAAAWPGIDAGWRRALLEEVERLPADDGSRDWLVLSVDQDPFYGLSLHAFRRRPWPARWPLVEVRLAAVRALRRLPSAAVLPGTAPDVFSAAGCYE